MAKYGKLRSRVVGELPAVSMLEAPRASDAELALAHTPSYIVASVMEGTISASALREIGFPWSAAMVERSRRSAGATVAAVRSALKEGLAAPIWREAPTMRMRTGAAASACSTMWRWPPA